MALNPIFTHPRFSSLLGLLLSQCCTVTLHPTSFYPNIRHIIEYIGCGSSDTSSANATKSSLFLVEEFVDGGTLMRVVCRQMDSDEEIYRLEDAVRWLVGIAQGLKYLHQCQPMVIHRDLKLENILMSGENGGRGRGRGRECERERCPVKGRAFQ